MRILGPIRSSSTTQRVGQVVGTKQYLEPPTTYNINVRGALPIENPSDTIWEYGGIFSLGSFPVAFLSASGPRINNIWVFKCETFYAVALVTLVSLAAALLTHPKTPIKHG